MIVLGVKSDYSFQRGFGTAKQWLDRCKETGTTVLGIADYCSTWGHAPFKKAFEGAGIRLLYGVQVPVVAYLDKDPRHSLVTLYAKENLTELYQAMTLAHQQTYYRPRLTWNQLRGLKDCAIVINSLLRTHRKVAEDTADFMGDNGDLPDFMAKLDLPRVIDYSPRYPSPDDRQGFEIFLKNSSQSRLGEVDFTSRHMLRLSEFSRLFDVETACQAGGNVEKLVDQCTADIPRASLLPYPEITDKRARLEQMARAGAMRLGVIHPVGVDKATGEAHYKWGDGYAERLTAELDVICEKKFEDYFFFVTEICEWAEERMLIGPGRGSAGGSLLCYLLGITHVDPLRFGTMFERFIDVTRNDLPDIDIDFADTSRDQVYEFIKSRFGADRFAKLGTLTEVGGKSAFNMIARTMDVPYEAARECGKFTEGGVQGKVLAPQWVFDNVEEVKPILERHPALALAATVDGHITHHGVHASGVVVAPAPVSNFGTVDREGVLSMDMKTAEDIGFVKLDVLGLTTLSVIQECCNLAGIDPRALRKMDFNDLEIFDQIFNRDRVTGVFQFGGNTVRGLMKQVKIDKFDDICALTSLARPGPLQGGAAAGWVKARNGGDARDSIHPALDATYGVICYQEQMMAICRDCAGFDVAGVNGMRRAVAKKDPIKLASYRPLFVDGMKKFFVSRMVLGQTTVPQPKQGEAAQAQAEQLWEEICEFGYYAFNFAHATAYGMLSMMTAYLKLKHPLEFAVAQLRFAADEDDAKHLLRELIEEGYQYVPFDAARSQATWSISNSQLIGGFDSIRGIGVATAERLVAKREVEGPGWIANLTDAMRDKVLGAKTPWASLSYFTDKFRGLYADPAGFRCDTISKGIKPPVYRIRDIPEEKGEYAFLGRITMRKHVDANEPERAAKRGGKKFTKDTHFINLTIEDDTGEVGATINRFKASAFNWLIEEDLSGRDFLFRGNVIEQGRRWLFIEKVIEIK